MDEELTPDSPDTDGADAAGGELMSRLLRNANACPADVVTLAHALCAVTRTSMAGDQMPGAVLADRFVVLARIRTMLDGELGRCSAAAESRDVLAHTPSSTLQKEAGWTKSDATALVVAARFAARHDDLAAAWRSGTVATSVVATLARGLSGVAADAEDRVVAAVTPDIGQFSVAGMGMLVSRALDLMNPEQRDQAEHPTTTAAASCRPATGE